MTNASSLCTLCFSLRGSERIATLSGHLLDTVKPLEPHFAALKGWLLGEQADGQQSTLTDWQQDLAQGGATAQLTHQMGQAFSCYRHKSIEQDVVIELDADATTGVFKMIACSVWFSSAQDLERTQGDDLVIIVMLERSALPPEVQLIGRPQHPQNTVQFLKDTGLLPSTFQWTLEGNYRPGFYVIEHSKPCAANPASLLALSALSAYLFLNYLSCLRIERQLLAIQSNQDWDVEYRKLLLIQRQLLVTQKLALLKNRAEPNTDLLHHFLKLLAVLRLTEQTQHLKAICGDTTQLLQTENTYRSSKRIASIQLILFISTVLGLAIAINAIQMKPFFDDKTQNALMRPIFWYVVGIVVTGGCGLSLLAWQWSTLKNKIQKRWMTA